MFKNNVNFHSFSFNNSKIGDIFALTQSFINSKIGDILHKKQIRYPPFSLGSVWKLGGKVKGRSEGREKEKENYLIGVFCKK